MRFKNKTVIITGASRGIGAETAIQFAKEGANVVIDYFVSDYEPDAEENANVILKKIKKIGTNAIKVNCDVRDQDQILILINKSLESFG